MDEITDYKVKKSTCERYDLRWERGGWAIITIDENGGLFNAQSDYGSYSYLWPCHGRESFKHFIQELATDSSYFLEKVAKADHFDFEENLKGWKRKLIELRKTERWEKSLSKKNIKAAWDFFEEIDSCYSKDMVELEIYNSGAIKDLGIDEPWYVFETNTDYQYCARYFANRVMPMFAEILQGEIEKDGGVDV